MAQYVPHSAPIKIKTDIAADEWPLQRPIKNNCMPIFSPKQNVTSAQ
jgi:hypothetical protein